MKPIIDVDWLLAHYQDSNVVLVDVRSPQAYASEHIPGARFANVYDYFATTDTEGIGELNAYVTRTLSSLGLSGQEMVVFYEDETGMVAPRGLWFFEYAGLRHGHVLDGGLTAWKVSDGRVVSGSGPWGNHDGASRQGDVSTSLSGHRTDLIVVPNLSVLATVDDILHLDEERSALLDVRRESEYVGTWEQACCPRSGRIHGAVRLYWEEFIDSGKYATPAAIRQRAAAAGVSPDKEVIVYCHRGGRSATAFYALRLAGFGRVRNYIGSWHEWSNCPELQVATG
jgi:thiosulfate/3-mercaptopyruvate sulfurtransferase